MATFATPQLLKRYSDGTMRIVTHKEINVGDTISFKNERWLDETHPVMEILESRPSVGEFSGTPPTSYRIKGV